MIDAELIAARRDLRMEGYSTLCDVGLDGPYVSPLQILAHSRTGPVLLAYHWLDAATASEQRVLLRQLGYLPGIPFNKVVDRALDLCGMTRCDVYMTQAFCLLPAERSSFVPARDVDVSFKAVTKAELESRRVVALGGQAAAACRRNGITVVGAVPHPSARGLSVEAKAAQLAGAIRAALG